MASSLRIPQEGRFDFMSLGALVHRLDPGIVPFRKATHCDIHVSGGEFNCAANLANCFGMRTAIATAMVSYPIGDLIAERVRAMGVVPLYKHFTHDGSRGPNMATVYSDRGFGVRPAGGLLQPVQKPPQISSPEISIGRRFLRKAFAGSTVVAFSRRSPRQLRNW